LFSGGRVQVTLLAGPDVGGLCGEILKQFPRRGEQGADLLLTGMGSPIATVKSELAEHGYMRQTLKRHRVVGNKVQAVVDCERIQTLAEDCALAMDWWDQAWAADVPLSHALLADCTKSLKPKGGA
jgi:hypothetical protein